MSITLEGLQSQLNKARNYCYYGKYNDSIGEFNKVQSKIESELFHINDKILLDQWTKLLDQIKYQINLVQSTCQMLNGNIQRPIPSKHVKQSGSQREIGINQNNSRKIVAKQQSLEKKSKFPFGKEPFKKRVHQDDQVYNKKQKQRRREQQDEQRRQREYERELDRKQKQKQKSTNANDQQVWDDIFPKQKPQPKPMAKKQHPIYNANKIQRNPSMVQKDNKNRQYEKPWKNNAKKKDEKKEQGDEKKSFLKFCYPDGNGPDSNLIQALQREVVELSPQINFDDIAQLTKAKEILEEAVLLPLALPHLFVGNRRAWKGVLLFGPPGTGKTLLAKAVASTGATTFFNVTASSLASKWRGQAQKMVRLLFEMARFYAPSTIFIDEIDSLASARGQKQDQSSRRVKTQLMTRIDGCTTGSQDNKLITVIGATNRPWDLDQAIRRRLQKRIYIPLPTQVGRRQLLRINLKNQKLQQSVDLQQIVQGTEGYSGADIAGLCRQAAYMPMRRKLKAEGGLGKKLNDVGWKEQFEKDVNIPLTKEDFSQAMLNVKSSVGVGDLKNYQDWMAEFGQQGTK